MAACWAGGRDAALAHLAALEEGKPGRARDALLAYANKFCVYYNETRGMQTSAHTAWAVFTHLLAPSATGAGSASLRVFEIGCGPLPAATRTHLRLVDRMRPYCADAGIALPDVSTLGVDAMPFAALLTPADDETLAAGMHLPMAAVQQAQHSGAVQTRENVDAACLPSGALALFKAARRSCDVLRAFGVWFYDVEECIVQAVRSWHDALLLRDGGLVVIGALSKAEMPAAARAAEVMLAIDDSGGRYEPAYWELWGVGEAPPKPTPGRGLPDTAQGLFVGLRYIQAGSERKAAVSAPSRTATLRKLLRHVLMTKGLPKLGSRWHMSSNSFALYVAQCNPTSLRAAFADRGALRKMQQTKRIAQHSAAAAAAEAAAAPAPPACLAEWRSSPLAVRLCAIVAAAKSRTDIDGVLTHFSSSSRGGTPVPADAVASGKLGALAEDGWYDAYAGITGLPSGAAAGATPAQRARFKVEKRLKAHLAKGSKHTNPAMRAALLSGGMLRIRPIRHFEVPAGVTVRLEGEAC